MHKSKNILFNKIFIFIVTSALIFTPVTKAAELVITENGSESSNLTSVSSQSTTIIEQTNDAEVTNDVNTLSTTGDNSASGNSGDSLVNTGDTSTDITIKNNADYSEVDAGDCCLEGTDASITGNGSQSENTINLTQDNSTTTLINQSANISNNIQGTANTGNNNANGNTGEVSIITGDIRVNAEIVNGPINVSSVETSNEQTQINAKITANGYGSQNQINTDFKSDNFIEINQTADISNTTFWNLNTGGNDANSNEGNVEIVTGDIDFSLFIRNLVNLSTVKVDCCGEDDEEEKPEENEKPEDGRGGKDNEGDGDGNGEGNKEESKGVLLPEAASTIGGPQVIGLSDTSSEAAQNLFFWAGLVLITMGVRFIGQGLTPKKLARHHHFV